MIETLRGQVRETRVIREGWGILTILAAHDGRPTNVTGHPLGIEVGDTVEIAGEWMTHPKFGRQFRAKQIVVVAPSDASGAIEWILSRLPNVGRKRATAIVERWGIPGVWEVLEHHHAELVKIDGVTPARAAQMHAVYMQHIGERDRIVALRGFGLSDRQAARVVQKWGDSAIETLREDPYVLAEEIDGFGFKRSDFVALKMGLPRHHPSRIRAGLAFILEEAASAGHVYVPSGKLIALAERLLGIDADHIRREGREAIKAGKMVQRGARCYTPGLDVAEQRVAECVRLMTAAKRWEGAAA